MNNIFELNIDKNGDYLENLLSHLPENQKRRLIENNYRFHMGYF